MFGKLGQWFNSNISSIAVSTSSFNGVWFLRGAPHTTTSRLPKKSVFVFPSLSLTRSFSLHKLTAWTDGSRWPASPEGVGFIGHTGTEENRIGVGGGSTRKTMRGIYVWDGGWNGPKRIRLLPLHLTGSLGLRSPTSISSKGDAE